MRKKKRGGKFIKVYMYVMNKCQKGLGDETPDIYKQNENLPDSLSTKLRIFLSLSNKIPLCSQAIILVSWKSSSSLPPFVLQSYVTH